MKSSLGVTALMILSVTAVTALAFALAAPGAESPGGPAGSAGAPQSGVEAVSAETASGAAGGDDAYLLGEYEGRLALFLNGSAYPQKVYEVFLHHLPAYDQELLREGLPVESREALNRLLEDYLS